MVRVSAAVSTIAAPPDLRMARTIERGHHNGDEVAGGTARTVQRSEKAANPLKLLGHHIGRPPPPQIPGDVILFEIQGVMRLPTSAFPEDPRYTLKPF